MDSRHQGKGSSVNESFLPTRYQHQFPRFRQDEVQGVDRWKTEPRLQGNEMDRNSKQTQTQKDEFHTWTGATTQTLLTLRVYERIFPLSGSPSKWKSQQDRKQESTDLCLLSPSHFQWNVWIMHISREEKSFHSLPVCHSMWSPAGRKRGCTWANTKKEVSRRENAGQIELLREKRDE